jgi:hypothetical protein
MRRETRAEIEAAFEEDRDDWIIDPASPYRIEHQRVKSLAVIFDEKIGADPWTVYFEYLPRGRYQSVAAAAQMAREILK